MSNDPAYTVIASGFGFCEAPRVDDDGTVWFSDLLAGGYQRVSPDGAVKTFLADRIWIGGAARDKDGSMLLGGKGGLIRLDPATGAATTVLASLNGTPLVAVNDMEADPHGGLFLGTIDFVAIMERGEIPDNGQLVYLSPTGDVRVLRNGLTASNGLGFSPDGKTLYHSESTKGLWAYPLDDAGMPGEPTLLVALDDCDGLAVDSAGAIWVAFWRAAVLRRYLPDGTLDQTITLPFPNLISVAFGGPDLHDLYIATGTSEDQPDKGGIIKIRVDVPGQREYRTRLGQTKFSH
jgi:sugar lactone lactonase YvrE